MNPLAHIDIQDIVRISKEAGARIMEIYHSAEGIEIDRKADNSPLTNADKASNDHIVSYLRKVYPDIPLISEEEKLTDYAERKDWEWCWEIDPLDGTKEFIKRNGEFTTNIALIHRGVPVLGVIHAPALNLTAWAIQNEGAWLEENGTPVQLQSQPPARGEALKIVASRSHHSPELQAFLATFSTPPEIRSAGSSLKFLLLARGEAHLYPRLAPTMEWDTSAGQIILTEAGGEILIAETQQPLRYNRPDLLNPHFIAYAHDVREALKKYLSK